MKDVARGRTIGPVHTPTELATILGQTREVIRLATTSIPPVGMKGSQGLFPLIAVAVKVAQDSMLGADVVAHVMRMDPDDLPAKLKKAFWDGQSAKLKYQRDAGELWPTERVVEFAGDTFKTIRLSLQLITDSLERETGLTVKQRDLIQEMIDSILNDMRERLIHVFESKRTVGSDGQEVDFASETEDEDEDL